MSALFPSLESITFRKSVAQKLYLLRRTRPKIPFYELPAHRVPTRWYLYRRLLANTPSPEIRWRVTTLFRKFQHLTSPDVTRTKLARGHQLLEIFSKERSGDPYWGKVLQRYSRMIATKQQKARMDRNAEEYLEWMQQLKRRPILTGGYLRPSTSNKPLPRMKPQPVHVSMMIRKRRKKRAARFTRLAVHLEWLRYLRYEHTFEKILQKKVGSHNFTPEFDGGDWTEPIRDQLAAMKESTNREDSWARMKYSIEMMERIKEARREKIRNLTRLKERERRGEVTPRVLAAKRRGLPAHRLALLGKKGQEMHRLVLDPSQGGYAGLVKKQAGITLTHDTSELEDSASEEAKALAKIIRLENKRRPEHVSQPDSSAKADLQSAAHRQE
ncbi:hypothetical protein FRC03_004153 [Tulasnella sp. 419]|nr:hypothetical protein FRC03_004153 [Tulasnella sp. 419]